MFCSGKAATFLLASLIDPTTWMSNRTAKAPPLVSSVTESSVVFVELIDQKTDKFSPYMIAGKTTALTEHSNR